MIFSNLLNEVITISRLTLVSGTNKSVMATVTAISVNKQSVSEEKSSLFGGVYGSVYAIYCDITVDIKEGDKIKDEDGNLYSVQKGGVTKFDMGGMEFLKVIIIKTS